MTDSILDSVKEALGLPVDSSGFESEIIMYINSVFSTLNQLGVGPVEGFRIDNNTPVWADFLGPDSLKFNDVNTYMVFRVKLMFDPPATSFGIDAMQEQIKEAAWRINVAREETAWVDPNAVLEDPTLF